MPSLPEFAAAALVAAVLVILFTLFARAYGAFRDAGFTTFEAALVLVAAPLAHGVNVVVAAEGNLLLAVNAAGLVVPLVVSVKLVLEERVPRVRTALAVALVALVAFDASALVPERGVEVRVLAPIAAAVVLGFVATLGDVRRAPLAAYVAGALGTLIGADLVRLPDVLALQPTEPVAMSVGGAGTLDAVFLVGLVAVALQLLLFAVFGKPKARKTRR